MIIWLASYPKSGNTWLRALLTSYYYTKDGNFDFNVLYKIYQFPAKKFFKPYKKNFTNVFDTAEFWIDAQKKINSDKIYILNFWATWCAPCKEEMPSLDKLHAKDGIFVFPINLEDKNLKKTDKFYDDLNITNLNIYFDEGLKLTKAFSIRGVPTTIIFNKNKDEVARIKGSVDFSDKKFISWLDSIE